RAHPVLHRLARGRFSGDLRSVWGTLARTFETVLASARPADHIPRRIGDRHNRVVECALNMGLPPGHILLFAALTTLPLRGASCATLRLLFCHNSSVETFQGVTLNFERYFLAVFFLIPIACPRRPRRVRALVRVRCPRTGIPLRCRTPR